MRFLVLFTFFFSISVFAQNGNGGGGGPGMVLKYVDSDGIARELIVEEGGLNVPAELMDQYLEQLRARELDSVINRRRDIKRFLEEAQRRVKFESLGNALDVTTTSGDILDRQALRDLNPSWMRESDGEVWVSERAPIVDYQMPSGEIIHFNSGPKSNQDIYWNPDLD